MKRYSIAIVGGFMVMFTLAILWSCGTTQTQTVTKRFTFTAPDADGGGLYPNPVGNACDQYDFRIATDSIYLINDWNNCDGGILMDTPPAPNTRDTVEVGGFNPTTIYFCAIKAGDGGKFGEISNIVMVTTEDLGDPAKIIDLEEVQ